MTDEASPYFWASIDNIVEGHQFLHREVSRFFPSVRHKGCVRLDQVGVLPAVQWSNDPFGYGPSVPLLFRKAGLEHLAVNRVHRLVKMTLEKRGAGVFDWRQRWSPSLDVTTHLLPFAHYDVPNSCGPDPSVCCQFDFKRLTDFTCPGPKPVPITPANVADRARLLFDQYQKTAQLYPANVMLLVLGDDFRYIDQREW